MDAGGEVDVGRIVVVSDERDRIGGAVGDGGHDVPVGGAEEDRAIIHGHAGHTGFAARDQSGIGCGVKTGYLDVIGLEVGPDEEGGLGVDLPIKDVDAVLGGVDELEHLEVGVLAVDERRDPAFSDLFGNVPGVAFQLVVRPFVKLDLTPVGELPFDGDVVEELGVAGDVALRVDDSPEAAHLQGVGDVVMGVDPVDEDELAFVVLGDRGEIVDDLERTVGDVIAEISVR